MPTKNEMIKCRDGEKKSSLETIMEQKLTKTSQDETTVNIIAAESDMGRERERYIERTSERDHGCDCNSAVMRFFAARPYKTYLNKSLDMHDAIKWITCNA